MRKSKNYKESRFDGMGKKGRTFTLVLIATFLVLGCCLFVVLRLVSLKHFAIGLYSATKVDSDGSFIPKADNKTGKGLPLGPPYLSTVSIRMPLWIRIEKGTAGQTNMQAFGVLLTSKGCMASKLEWLEPVFYKNKVYEQKQIKRVEGILPGFSTWLVVIRLPIKKSDRETVEREFPHFEQCLSAQSTMNQLHLWSQTKRGHFASKQVFVVP